MSAESRAVQPCAVCRGITVRREIVPGEVSNYCLPCAVFTADSDGQETARRDRGNALFLQIARAAVSRAKSSGAR